MKPDHDDWLSDCAQYLVQLRDSQEMFERPSFARLNEAARQTMFHDFEGVRTELDAAAIDLQRAYGRLSSLRAHFARSELVPFDGLAPAVYSAATRAAQACAELNIARHRLETYHPPRTRAMSLQQTAVRLAYAHLHTTEPRQVRRAAKKIMLLAGLAEPSDRAITAWIREEENSEPV
jgi:hypothetical protein